MLFLCKRVCLFPQRTAGPATLESTSGACSLNSREYAECPCEYSEYPTAGSPPAPPQPTVEAVDGTSTPPYRRILQSGYSKYPTVSTQSTPPQVRRHSRRRRSRRWVARAHRRTPQVRGLKVPVGSTQSTPWECGLNPMGVLRVRLVSTPSMPCEYSKYHTGRLGSYTQHGTPYEYSKSTLAGSFSAIPTWAFPSQEHSRLSEA